MASLKQILVFSVLAHLSSGFPIRRVTIFDPPVGRDQYLLNDLNGEESNMRRILNDVLGSRVFGIKQWNKRGMLNDVLGSRMFVFKQMKPTRPLQLLMYGSYMIPPKEKQASPDEIIIFEDKLRNALQNQVSLLYFIKSRFKS